MLPSWSMYVTLRPIGHWCWAIAMLFCLILAGCTNVDPRGPNFRDDDAAKTFQQLRSTERSGSSFGFSNKAKQIEEDFGYSK